MFDVEQNVESESSSDYGEVLFLGNVNIDSVINSGWLYMIGISYMVFNFKVDTGAQVEVLSVKDLDKVNIKKNLRKTGVNLSNYNGSTIKVIGKCELECTLETGEVETIDFLIVT